MVSYPQYAPFPVGLAQPFHHFDGRGLARTVGTEQPEHLSLAYLEAHAVYGREASVRFDQPVHINENFV